MAAKSPPRARKTKASLPKQRATAEPKVKICRLCEQEITGDVGSFVKITPIKAVKEARQVTGPPVYEHWTCS